MPRLEKLVGLEPHEFFVELINVVEEDIKTFEKLADAINKKINEINKKLTISYDNIENVKSSNKEEEEEDYLLEKVESSIKRAYEDLKEAIEKSTCSLCKDVLSKIKELPLERQVVAITELKNYMELAERGSIKDLEEYLKNTKELIKLLGGG